MPFNRPELIVDPSTIAENAKVTMEETLPGWAADSDPVVSAILEAVAIPAAEQAQALEVELIDAFKSIGALHGITPILASPAHALATFTLGSAAGVGGYTIPEGAAIGIRDPDFDLQGFRLISDLTVAEGATTATGTVEALTPGEEANNLSGAAILIDVPAAVIAASLATSGGGEEEEDEGAYLERLSEDLELFKVGVVRAADAAGVARQIAGVGRATAVDLLKPSAADGGAGAEETNAERTVTVAVTDSEGKPTSSGVRTAVLAKLVEGGIANMSFYVVTPHYEKIDATATVYAWPGLDLAQVEKEVEEALERLLNPATAQTGPSANPSRWANDPVIRQSEVFTAIMNVSSVRWCSTATFGAHGGALSTADHTLDASSAVPALPEVGTLTVTVEPTS